MACRAHSGAKKFAVKSLSEFKDLYIHRDPVDMRKNINGLSALVKEEMKLEFHSSSLFIFCNKPRTHMKILYFDQNGFALWLKRLEGSKFPWPKGDREEEVISVSHLDMNLLLSGINFWNRFKDVHFEYLV